MNSLPNLAINLHLAKILMRTQAIPAQKIKKMVGLKYRPKRHALYL